MNDITLTITGNVVTDVALRFTKSGEPVASFRMAADQTCPPSGPGGPVHDPRGMTEPGSVRARSSRRQVIDRPATPGAG